jgi:hypothetical protein
MNNYEWRKDIARQPSTNTTKQPRRLTISFGEDRVWYFITNIQPDQHRNTSITHKHPRTKTQTNKCNEKCISALTRVIQHFQIPITKHEHKNRDQSTRSSQQTLGGCWRKEKTFRIVQDCTELKLDSCKVHAELESGEHTKIISVL